MFKNQNEGDIQTIDRKIQDCDDKIANLEQRRAGIKQQGESEHSAYLDMKATDGAIKAIRREKERYEEALGRLLLGCASCTANNDQIEGAG